MEGAGRRKEGYRKGGETQGGEGKGEQKKQTIVSENQEFGLYNFEA